MEVKICPACGKENKSDAKECMFSLEALTNNVKSISNEKEITNKKQELNNNVLDDNEILPLCKSLNTCGVILLICSLIVAIIYIIDGVSKDDGEFAIAGFVTAFAYFFSGIITLYFFKWMAYMLKTNYDIKNKLK